MTIRSEWQILEKIRNFLAERETVSAPRLLLSLGDDCAVFQPAEGRLGLLTADMSVEGVHFRRDLSGPEDIGYKAMTGNLSDIASMGGTPLYALISLGLPGDVTEAYTLSLYRGFLDAAESAGTRIAGGDLSASDRLTISISLYGEAPPEGAIRRSGARPGDTLYLTGFTGGSLAGLEMLKKPDTSPGTFPMLIQRHNRPAARCGIVSEIIQIFRPTSMIDISDGLVSDLRHICEESGTGFRLYRDRLPSPQELRDYCRLSGRDISRYLLESGEEYELLFTSAKPLAESMRILVNGIPVTAIGDITESGFILSTPEGECPLPLSGYDHFAKQRKE